MRFVVDSASLGRLMVIISDACPVSHRVHLTNLSMCSSLQVKVAILKYIETLAKQMDPGDFINSSETRLAVSRVITWTTEPKSSDVRKVSLSRIGVILGIC